MLQKVSAWFLVVFFAFILSVGVVHADRHYSFKHGSHVGQCSSSELGSRLYVSMYGSSVGPTDANGLSCLYAWGSYTPEEATAIINGTWDGTGQYKPGQSSGTASSGAASSAASAAAQAAGAAAGGLYFGGRIATVVPCDVGELLTIVGVPYSGPLMWTPPGGAPPYLINMSAPPTPTQCITGAMGPPIVCTISGEPVGAGPVILRYGSGLPGCVTGMSPPAGAPGGGANPLASLGQQLQDTLKNLGMSSVSSLLQAGQGGKSGQAGGGTQGGSPSGTPSCKSSPGGSASDVRRATTAVTQDFAGSCVSVSATSCLDVIRGGRTTFGTQCTTVGSKSCSILSYIETMCGRCSGAAVTVIGRESALAPGSTRAVDVAFDERLNQCVLAYTSIGKTLRGYDAYRDSVTRATWVRVVRDSDQYWHVCAPGTVCN